MEVLANELADIIRWGDTATPGLITQEYELQLDVPIELAWQRMVHEVDSWWPHCYKPGSTVLLEAFPGGRWWERFADGVNGSVWGNVMYIEPPRVLKVVGQFALPGVSNSSGIWRFSEREDGGTQLRVSGEIFGALDFDTMKSRREGSVSVVTSLRDFVNSGVRIPRALDRQ